MDLLYKLFASLKCSEELERAQWLRVMAAVPEAGGMLPTPWRLAIASNQGKGLLSSPRLLRASTQRGIHSLLLGKRRKGGRRQNKNKMQWKLIKN